MTPLQPFGHYFRDMAGNQHFHTGATPPSFAHSEITPLYAHPSRGVVDEAMVERVMDADALEYGASIPASRVRRILEAAALPAVPDGWKLVPERMHLSVESLEALSFQCGGVDPESADPEERWCSGTLWVGDILDDDGKPTHGLHLSNDECPEEGSMTLVEFAATPAHDQPEGEG